MVERTKLTLAIACALVISACSASNDAHYAELEKHRQQQAAQPASSTSPAVAASPVPSASVTGSPTATATAPAEQAPAGRNYWTNFRGPKRDGKYDETTVSTN